MTMVPDAMVKVWIGFGILLSIDGMDFDPTLAFVAEGHLCEVDW